jgi:serine/threonine protein phosphatase PrpC
VSFQVFDGHGGSDAAAYVKRHAMRFLFEDGEFPQASHVDEVFLQSVENSVHRTFLQADLALADNMDISRSSGTTALTALVFGRQVYSGDSCYSFTNCLFLRSLLNVSVPFPTLQATVGCKYRGLPCGSVP